SLVINEYESCKDVKPDGDAFVIETEREKTRQRVKYRARRVILAIGNRGAPMKLNLAGEDLKITVTPRAAALPHFFYEYRAKRGRLTPFRQRVGPKINSEPPKVI